MKIHFAIRRTIAIVAVFAAFTSAVPAASAVTPASPEVRDLVKKGLKFLDENSDPRLGGKCVIALAYLKTKPPQPNHPRVQEALAACKAESRSGKGRGIDMYSNGLAIIFLCELDPRKHSELIKYYLGLLKQRQKEHGGWGYNEKETGDTSQSQYAALSLWEAHNNGLSVDSSSVAELADWLVHTQDPSGGWGYQGKYVKSEERVEQELVGCSMVAAAMGSSLIAADLFGVLSAGAEEDSEKQNVPDALRAAGEKERRRAPSLRSSSFDRSALFQAIRKGNAWMDKNYVPSIGRYSVYYLYSLERYKSFQEILDGVSPDEPEWYRKGYEYLKSKQGGDGSWSVGCGPGPDTALAILFLVRSTKQILNRPIGDLRIGRRGFPKPSANVEMKNGEFVIKQTEAALGELINMLDADSAEAIDALANDPTALLVTGEVDEAAAQRLQQIVRSGSPPARVIAVRTLGRTGKLDYVPTMIFALTDPDKRVVLEARDTLRFISRRFLGFGLKENFTEKERYTAIDKWKDWYLSIRPDAIITLN